MRNLWNALLICCALMALGHEAQAAAGSQTLEAVVLINRHSIRSPLTGNFTGTSIPYTAMSRDEWPDFKVDPGKLTPRGALTAQTFGAFYGQLYQQAGLLPGTGCLARSQVWVHSDSDQRTIRTARKLMDGMTPGCSYPVTHVAQGTTDPLIDPVKAGVCELEAGPYDASQDALLGSNPEIVFEAYRPSLEKLQDVLDCCKPSLCRKFVGKRRCTLSDLPASVALDGATNISENFLMEYANRFRMRDVGWGRIQGPQEISHINMTHALNFWSGNANPYGAAVLGSNLMNRALTALQAAAQGQGPVFSLIVAHDNNLLNIAGLLGLSWFLDGYQQNEVPPGAGIALELWRDDTSRQPFVKVVLRAQTMDQLRNNTPLSPDGTNPASSDQTPIACGITGVENGCSLATFALKVQGALLSQCISESSIGRSG
ncbi:histidine-type phosphatase [Microbaculum marinum]|uniref:Histidine-type phosphatase n=1 Tax=Microbaculum marinum TaxID=1764581 RepID=A0AAW9RE92_9HYPH